MVAYRIGIFFVEFMFFIFTLSFLEQPAGLCHFFVELLLNFLLVFDITFVVSNPFVECLTVQTALDLERETSIATQFRKPEEIHLLIFLNKWDVEIFLFGLNHLSFLFLGWRLFLFEHFIGPTTLIGQDLLNHDSMRL
jgi:hypothetical protein